MLVPGISSSAICTMGSAATLKEPLLTPPQIVPRRSQVPPCTATCRYLDKDLITEIGDTVYKHNPCGHRSAREGGTTWGWAAGDALHGLRPSQHIADSTKVSINRGLGVGSRKRA